MVVILLSMVAFLRSMAVLLQSMVVSDAQQHLFSKFLVIDDKGEKNSRLKLICLVL
jgi:hypothetical protein